LIVTPSAPLNVFAAAMASPVPVNWPAPRLTNSGFAGLSVAGAMKLLNAERDGGRAARSPGSTALPWLPSSVFA
jgi:hypothetical protein